MNRLVIWSGILSLLAINICILTTRDMYLLSLICFCVYLYGYFTQSKRKTMQRLQTFMFIGASLILLQTIFNQAIPMADRITNGLRVILQIASISQLVYLLVQRVSPSALIGTLGFLPRTWQLLIAMTFTFIPVLVQEQELIQISQKSRGLGLTWRSRLLAPLALFVPLMHRILQRSETIGLTMLARGFEEE